jgi:hypothetical protein
MTGYLVTALLSAAAGAHLALSRDNMRVQRVAWLQARQDLDRRIELELHGFAPPMGEHPER